MYIINFLPNIKPPDIKVEITKERIERGKYLAYHVTPCMDCHSTRDWTKFTGPMIPGTEGKGGEVFDKKLGFPGTFYSSNITPYNLNKWSDGEILRAIINGVGKGDRPLFPIMPYLNFAKLNKEDLYSIIAYIRSLPSIQYNTPPSKADFPMNIILHTMPQKAEPQTKPAKTDKINYGKYLATVSGCYDCHTKFENGKYDETMKLAGAREFDLPSGILRTANITPDVETGIGAWSEEAFVGRFKNYDPKTYVPPIVKASDFNTIMPWIMYAGMDKEDLEAIYAFLRTVKPIKNQIVRFTPKN